MERLGPLDAAFLDLEDGDRHASLAIASVAVLSGPAPGQDEYVAAIGPRFAAIRRARQRVVRVPFDLGAPVWADDPDFDVGYHFRRTAVPAPGDDEALHRLVARIMAQRLDRDRPLWECWVIEGLAGDRWAVLTKLHHCMADGVSGTRLYHAVFADTPAVAATAATDPAPGPVSLVLDAVGDLTRKAVGQVGVLLGAVRAPMRVLRGAAELAAAIRPTTPSSLSGPIGTARRYHVARVPLPAIVRVAKAYGTTVNDVVLTAVSAGMRALLVSRSERPDPRTVRTLVPVSVRANDERDELDNRVSLLLPYLPVDIAAPVDALAEVHRRLVREKATGEAEAGQAITALTAREPFAPVSVAVRFAARLPQRSIVTVTTNVPGPRAPLHVLGRKVLELLPYVPIAMRMRLGVAVMTYCDEAVFGVTADFATMPDARLVADTIERAVAELVSSVDTGAVRPRVPRPASLSGSSPRRDG